MTTYAALSARGHALRLPKIDTRLVVGLLLVALSVLGGLRLAATSDETVAVYVATRDLPADRLLSAKDLRVTRIRASDDTLAGLLVATSGSPPVHRVLRFPVAEGGLVATSSLGGTTSQGREITVPIGADHALGGALEVGDRVDILASFDKGSESAKTLTISSARRSSTSSTPTGCSGNEKASSPR